MLKKFFQRRRLRAAARKVSDGNFHALSDIDKTKNDVINAVSMACVSRIASRVAVAEWRVVDRDGNEAKGYERVKKLLFRPAGNRPRSEFFRTLTEQLLVDGNAYFTQRLSEGKVTGLVPLESRHVSISLTEGEPIRYEVKYTNFGRRKLQGTEGDAAHLSLGEIGHARIGIIDHNTGRGTSPLAHSSSAIRLYNTSLDSADSMLKNSVKIGTFFRMTDPMLVDSESYEMMKQQLQDILQIANSGKSFIAPAGIELQTPARSMPDLLMDKYTRLATEDIARSFGVPLPMIQATGGASGSSDELESRLVRDAVTPVVLSIEDALTNLLIDLGDKDKYCVKANLLPLNSVAPQAKVSTAMTMGQTGVVTINEIRKVLGLPPIEGGDEMPQTAGAGERSSDGSEGETDGEEAPDEESGDNEGDQDEQDDEPTE